MRHVIPNQPHVLLIEDELPIRRFLRAALAASYRLSEAETGADGLRLAAQQPPDVIILDLGLPDLDGIEVTRRLREWSVTPIIVLSARGQDLDKVAALDAGADDYLTKPFSMTELQARIRVALRRRAIADAPAAQIQIGALAVDLVGRQVSVAGQEIHLTPIEYGLLSALARHCGRVVTHQQLLREVWGPGYAEETQYLRVYVGQLRRKIEADAARPRYLLTEPGVGYRLASE